MMKRRSESKESGKEKESMYLGKAREAEGGAKGGHCV